MLSPSALVRYARLALPKPAPSPDDPPLPVLHRDRVAAVPERVEQYAALVGQAPGEHLPVLYPHLLGFDLQLDLLSDRRLPLPALGLVHVTNSVTVQGRIPRTAVLDVAVRAVGPHPHARGRTMDLITEVTQEGALVWSETSTYLRREAAGPSAGDRRATERPTTERPTTDREAVDRDTVAPSAAPISARWPLGADLGRRYAQVSGDVNPIHLFPLTAKAFGFRRQIAHGMWTAAAVIAALDHRLPDAFTYQARFRRPIPLPSTVWLHTAVRDDGAADAEVRRGDELCLAAEFRPLTAD